MMNSAGIVARTIGTTVFRCLSTSVVATAPITNVTVIGSGLMGSGIAQVSAQSGYNVVMVDQSDAILEKSMKNLTKSLSRVVSKKFPDDQKGQEVFKKDVLDRLVTTTDVVSSVANADLVIEAILEQVAPKQQLFSVVEQNAPSHCLFATNTSSLSLQEIASKFKAQDRFGGLHFFNPVPVMKLLEIVRLPTTSDDTFDTLVEYGKKLGKTTVSAKDTPGFIVNRLLVPYMMEALRMVERGDATVADVDVAMRLGAGYPMGPFELADYVGLDTTQFIIKGWFDKYPENPLFKPSPWLNRLVSEDKLGRKTGEGFYKY